MNLALVEKNTAWQRFYKDVQTGLAHAYIFLSEDSESLSSFLHFASLACFCPSVCCECDTCQSVSDGSHPDVYYGDGSQMKVDDIEVMLERVAIRPERGDKKIFIVTNADKLSVVCQNKILKTFEEPPYYVTIFLGASSESGLLPTIRSRGKKIYLDTISSEDIISELMEDGLDAQTAKISASYAMGNLTKAKQFSAGGDYREQYEKVFEMMINLKKSSQIAEYCLGEVFSKDNIALTLDFMEIILSDAMKQKIGSSAQTFTVGRERDLRFVASGFSAQGMTVALDAINKAKEQLTYYVNTVNVANGVLFGILEARYKWQKN